MHLPAGILSRCFSSLLSSIPQKADKRKKNRAPPPCTKSGNRRARRSGMSKGGAILENVIVAVLALAGTLAGTYFANRKSAALIAYRLEQLEKRVQAHNNLVERMYRLEEAFKTHEELASERLKAANHRIEDLEKSTD